MCGNTYIDSYPVSDGEVFKIFDVTIQVTSVEKPSPDVGRFGGKSRFRARVLDDPMRPHRVGDEVDALVFTNAYQYNDDWVTDHTVHLSDDYWHEGNIHN